MSLTPGTIKSKRIKKNVKRLGRGNGSGKGTYSGKGLKGQKSRSGNKGTKLRGLKPNLQKIPKLRGFRSISIKPEVVTLRMLEKFCDVDEELTPIRLMKKGLISHSKKGVKIVATGELKKKINFKGCLASKKAQEAIEKAGGKLTF